MEATLNGVLGDYLEASRNELATVMGFYENSKPLAHLDNLGNKLCVLVHGLTDDENSWNFHGTDYGALIEKDFGFHPLYLRYNTGLHISTNGRQLSNLLQSICKMNSVSDLVFLCHSMGGLVTRSAFHYAVTDGATWVQNVSQVVFIGTPHQGSPWEQLGNVVSSALGAVPRPYMKLAADITKLRSSGIKDLRYGYILDEDWQLHDEDALLTNTKTRAHLPEWIQYYVVTGTLTENPNHPLSKWLGDALVRKHSAEGKSNHPDHHLEFENCREFAGIGHCRLHRNFSVYQQISMWMSEKRPLIAGQEDGTQDSRNTLALGDTANVETDSALSQRWAKRKGIASLLQDGVGNGVSAVHDVHRSLSDETFTILGMTPLAPALPGVKTVHDTLVDGWYGAVRAISHGVTELAKL
mmetsp:Transcript_23189/g.37711  ORF Transcript_23189/g.37711 Transcript_23189/m.37711 type:complete len:411 (+) Transcript_23189:209-1441(+)